MNKNNYWSCSFIGVGLMLCCALFSSIILQTVNQSLLIMHQGAEQFVRLKMFSIPSALIVGILMIILTWGGRVKRGIYTYFGVHTLITCCYLFVVATGSELLSSPAVMGIFLYGPHYT